MQPWDKTMFPASRELARQDSRRADIGKKKKLRKRVARQECLASKSSSRGAVSDSCPLFSGSGGEGGLPAWRKAG